MFNSSFKNYFLITKLLDIFLTGVYSSNDETLQSIIGENSEFKSSIKYLLTENNTLSSNILKGRKQDKILLLPSMILKKVDRASMFYGIESRTPYLSTQLDMISTLSLSEEFKGKFYLKKLLHNLVTKFDLYTPQPTIKRGFKSNLRYYLEGPLKPFVDDYLSSNLISEILPLPKHFKKLTYNSFLSGDTISERSLYSQIVLHVFLSSL